MKSQPMNLPMATFRFPHLLGGGIAGAALLLAFSLAMSRPVHGQVPQVATLILAQPAPVVTTPDRPEEIDSNPRNDPAKTPTPTTPAETREHVGRVKQVAGRQLTFTHNETQKDHTVTVAEKASIELNRKPAKLEDLKPQDVVRITMSRSEPNTAQGISAARVVVDTPPQPTPRPVPSRVPSRVSPEIDADRQGGLGLTVTDSPDLGILVLGVHEKTPAWEAGLQIGDYLLKIDNVEMLTPEDFLKEIRANAPNGKVRLTIWRHGKPRQGLVALTTREAAQDQEVLDPRLQMLGKPGDQTTVIQQPTPRASVFLDPESENKNAAGVVNQQPNQTTGVVDQQPNQNQQPNQETGVSKPGEKLPADYDALLQEHRRLLERMRELERDLDQLKKQN